MARSLPINNRLIRIVEWLDSRPERLFGDMPVLKLFGDQVFPNACTVLMESITLFPKKIRIWKKKKQFD